MTAPDTPEPDPAAPGPLPRRVGFLTAAVVGVVATAWLVSTLFGGSAPVDTADATGAERAPNFTVDLIGGGTFDLATHLAEDGRPVILNFWASWCGPCRAEMPEFDRIAAEKPGLFVIGVAVQDAPESARAFAEEIGVSYPLAIDESETVAAAYPFLGLPSTWFIGEDGTIVREFAGQVNAETLREFIAADFGF